MSLNLKFLLFSILVLPESFSDDLLKSNNTNSFIKVYFLEPNTKFNFKSSKNGFFEQSLSTYCYKREMKSVWRILEAIEFQLEIEGDEFTQYEGETPAELEEHYLKHQSIVSFDLLSQKRSRLILSPFTQKCVGIETTLSYNITFFRQKIDFYRSIQLFSGITLFLLAGVLSANSMFYYIIGTLLGICSSVLMLVWLSGKLMPKRTMMYSVLIGGWTLGFYIIRMLWNNIQVVMMTYRSFLCWYAAITGIISFLLCYRWGPPRKRRSKNIIKWLLQLIASAIIYSSTYYKEAGCIIILILAVSYYFTTAFLNKTMNLQTKSSGQLKPNQNKNNKYEPKEADRQGQEKTKSSPALKENKATERNLKTEQFIAKRNTNRKQPDIDDYYAESDLTISEQDLTKQNLYPLHDGSFILCEKPPIIITPRHVPIYHRSTQSFFNDDQDEEDYTPKKHFSYVPLPAYSRRLSTASSASNLLFSAHSRNTDLPPSNRDRSSNVQSSPQLCLLQQEDI